VSSDCTCSCQDLTELVVWSIDYGVHGEIMFNLKCLLSAVMLFFASIFVVMCQKKVYTAFYKSPGYAKLT
jgi:hypothetical protein